MQDASSKFKCCFEPRKNKIPLQDFYKSCKSCLRLSVTFLALLLVYFTRTMQLTISKWMISSSVAIQGFSPLMPYKIKRLLLQEYWETVMLKMKMELRLRPGLWFIFQRNWATTTLNYTFEMSNVYKILTVCTLTEYSFVKLLVVIKSHDYLTFCFPSFPVMVLYKFSRSSTKHQQYMKKFNYCFIE